MYLIEFTTLDDGDLWQIPLANVRYIRHDVKERIVHVELPPYIYRTRGYRIVKITGNENIIFTKGDPDAEK